MMIIKKAVYVFTAASALAVAMHADTSNADNCDFNIDTPDNGLLCDQAPTGIDAARGRAFDSSGELGTEYTYGASLINGSAAVALILDDDDQIVLDEDNEPCPTAMDFSINNDFEELSCDIRIAFNAVTVRVGVD